MTQVAETIIHSNGSKWAGQGPDRIDKLFENLKNWELDPLFINALTTTPYRSERDGKVTFFGNFSKLSAVFRLTTSEVGLIAELTSLIEANPTVVSWRNGEGSFRPFSRHEQQILSLLAEAPINNLSDEALNQVLGDRARAAQDIWVAKRMIGDGLTIGQVDRLRY